MEEKKLTKYQLRRRELASLSIDAKFERDAEVQRAIMQGNNELALYLQGLRINDLLKRYIYEGKELRTFRQWKEAGYSIRKGAKAKMLWGKPIVTDGERQWQVDTPEDNGEDYDEIITYPIVLVFSEDDVRKLPPPKDRTRDRKPEEEPAE